MIAAKVIRLDFAKIEFFEKYVVVNVREGITIDQEHFALYKEVFTAYFNDKPYVYISDRSLGYNVNPMAYKYFEFSSILKGVAIVATGKISILNAEFEKNFMAKPFRVFQNMEDAINWANLLCEPT